MLHSLPHDFHYKLDNKVDKEYQICYLQFIVKILIYGITTHSQDYRIRENSQKR